MRILARLAYDGSAFSGFAPQKERGIISVAGRLREILGSVGIDSEILAAGRTDKGVHATAQMVSFDVVRLWDLGHLRTLLNKKGYPHIFFVSLRYVSEEFHPRFCALWRSYRYIVSLHAPKPFIARYVSYERYGELARVREALSLFRGRHNFALFKKQGTPSRDCVREILQSYVYRYDDFLVLHLRANGFLRAQVRLMLGAAFSYGRAELSKQQLQAQIDAKIQSYTMPLSPNGLYLCGVGYPALTHR